MTDTSITIDVWDGAGAGRYTVASVDELFALLELEAQRAERDECFPLAAIERNTKDMLLVGIGGQATAIEYYFGDEEESSLMAVSDCEADPVCFYAAGHESEYPPRWAIPTETARQIIRQYAENGTRSELVQWEQPQMTPHEVITSVPNPGERVKDVRFTSDFICVDLADGRTISAPLAWYPRLQRGTPEQREKWQTCGAGYGIHWPELDEDLSTEGLLRGAPAPGAAVAISAV